MKINQYLAFLLTILLLSSVMVMSAGAEIVLKEKIHSRQWLENGQLHYERNEYRKAMECFERALMIDRHNIDAEGMLNKVLEEVLIKVKEEQKLAKAAAQTESKQEKPLGATVAKHKAPRPDYVKKRPTMESEIRRMREHNLREGLSEKTNFKLLKGYLKNVGPRTKEKTEVEANLKTGNAEYHSKLGVKYAKTGNFEKAIEEFKAVLTLDPGNMFARMNLALCYAYSDQLYEAVKEYKKVLQLAPEGSKYATKAQKMLVKIKDLI